MAQQSQWVADGVEALTWTPGRLGRPAWPQEPRLLLRMALLLVQRFPGLPEAPGGSPQGPPKAWKSSQG